MISCEERQLLSDSLTCPERLYDGTAFPTYGPGHGQFEGAAPILAALSQRRDFRVNASGFRSYFSLTESSSLCWVQISSPAANKGASVYLKTAVFAFFAQTWSIERKIAVCNHSANCWGLSVTLFARAISRFLAHISRSCCGTSASMRTPASIASCHRPPPPKVACNLGAIAFKISSSFRGSSPIAFKT
jgi:hypothetical protein